MVAEFALTKESRQALIVMSDDVTCAGDLSQIGEVEGIRWSETRPLEFVDDVLTDFDESSGTFNFVALRRP